MENLYLSNIFCMSELIYLIRYEKIYDTKRGTCVMEKGLNWMSNSHSTWEIQEEERS